MDQHQILNELLKVDGPAIRQCMQIIKRDPRLRWRDSTKLSVFEKWLFVQLNVDVLRVEEIDRAAAVFDFIQQHTVCGVFDSDTDGNDIFVVSHFGNLAYRDGERGVKVGHFSNRQGEPINKADFFISCLQAHPIYDEQGSLFPVKFLASTSSISPTSGVTFDMLFTPSGTPSEREFNRAYMLMFLFDWADPTTIINSTAELNELYGLKNLPIRPITP